MILDSLLQFDSAAQLAQVVGTYNSTNILDLHITGGGLPVLANLQGARDIGIGDDPAMKLLVVVTTTFTSGGAATLTVNFQGATDNGSGAPSTWTTYYSSPAIALASLVASARLMDMDVPRPPAGVAVPRFLRLTYAIGAATTTAGIVASYIVLDRMDQMYQSTANSTMGGYPPGITIAN
jgi:hypothetical protein